ncbi:methyltransferase domain-containing protein [bacterium]|jgi:SAM-dependent methyltransferase|nr:methyltransferase domain-containing protein [bacterium]
MFRQWWLCIRQLPLTLRYRQLLVIDWTMFYFYSFIISPSRLKFERDKTGKPATDMTPGELSYLALEKALSGRKMDPKKDMFIDLGCGRGKLTFFVAIRYGIRSAGVDLVGTYIKAAQKLANIRKIKTVKFIQKDVINTRFSGQSTIVCLTWTMWTKASRVAVAKQCLSLKKGAWLITTTIPLKHASFESIKTFSAPSSWGSTIVYVHRKVS